MTENNQQSEQWVPLATPVMFLPVGTELRKRSLPETNIISTTTTTNENRYLCAYPLILLAIIGNILIDTRTFWSLKLIVHKLITSVWIVQVFVLLDKRNPPIISLPEKGIAITTWIMAIATIVCNPFCNDLPWLMAFIINLASSTIMLLNTPRQWRLVLADHGHAGNLNTYLLMIALPSIYFYVTAFAKFTLFFKSIILFFALLLLYLFHPTT